MIDYKVLVWEPLTKQPFGELRTWEDIISWILQEYIIMKDNPDIQISEIVNKVADWHGV
jgi:hypothetical protein